jgi:tight adherence protein B
LPVLGAMALGVLLQSAWLSLLLLVALPFGPRVSAALAQRRHRQALAQQMPTLVEALAAALRAGQSLPQALESAQDDLPAPGGVVVAGILRDVRLGEAPETVLERVAAAFGETPLATDWRLMATAVAIQRSSGGNLAEILDQLGETLRERQRLQAQVDALTAQGRLSAWVVGGLPPLLLLALQLLDPQLVAPLFQTPTGWVLLGLGALLEACGILILRRIVDINA